MALENIMHAFFFSFFFFAALSFFVICLFRVFALNQILFSIFSLKETKKSRKTIFLLDVAYLESIFFVIYILLASIIGLQP